MRSKGKLMSYFLGWRGGLWLELTDIERAHLKSGSVVGEESNASRNKASECMGGPSFSIVHISRLVTSDLRCSGVMYVPN